MCCRRKLSLGIALSITLAASQRAVAGDLLFLMTSAAYQYSIAIGTVISQSDGQLVFEPKQVLLGDRIPNEITIAEYTPAQVEGLSDGDFAILSLVRIDRSRQYKMSHPAFKASSPDPGEAKVINGPLSGGDLAAYNWFVNSCGNEKDFAFDYSGEVDIASVMREDGWHEIAQRSVDSPDGIWKMVAESPDCKLVRFGWWRSLVSWLDSIY